MSDTAAAYTTRAEGLLRQALAASPGNLQSHYAKGQLLRTQRRCEEAIPEYEAAIAGNRNWAGAIANLGQCKAFTVVAKGVIAPLGASHPPQPARSLHWQ